MHAQLRSLVVCSTVVALSTIGATACGTSSNGSSSAKSVSSTASTGGLPVLDGDKDNDSPGSSRYDSDNDEVLTFGPAADPVDRAAIGALIKSYYAAAAAGDGRRACSLTYWLFAESIVEEHHRGKGPRSLRGNTCAQISSKLFAQRHRELTEDVAALEVAAVQVKRKQGFVLVRFGKKRERIVLVHRDNGVWEMNVLLDNGPL